MTLYHGTTHNFDEIDVTHGKPFKDFGRGFYTTASREHALGLATRNRDIVVARRHAAGILPGVDMWLYTYEFPPSAMEKLLVKEFMEPNREWMLFVGANRASREPQHEYDIVIGPTANDRTNLSIKTYFFGGYGDVGSNEAIDILLAIIKPYELPPQVFFGTPKAAAQLIRTNKELIR